VVPPPEPLQRAIRRRILVAQHLLCLRQECLRRDADVSCSARISGLGPAWWRHGRRGDGFDALSARCGSERRDGTSLAFGLSRSRRRSRGIELRLPCIHEIAVILADVRNDQRIDDVSRRAGWRIVGRAAHPGGRPAISLARAWSAADFVTASVRQRSALDGVEGIRMWLVGRTARSAMGDLPSTRHHGSSPSSTLAPPGRGGGRIQWPVRTCRRSSGAAANVAASSPPLVAAIQAAGTSILRMVRQERTLARSSPAGTIAHVGAGRPRTVSGRPTDGLQAIWMAWSARSVPSLIAATPSTR
jgi:hypothetical protein